MRRRRSFHRAEYLRLNEVLVDAAERSHLPDEPTARAALHDLLLRIRLGAGYAAA